MAGIAVIAWGSLVWSPRNLRMVGSWALDGPLLPVEFSRMSSDGRLTLVVDAEHGVQVPTWVVESPLSPTDARINLAEREVCAPESIGMITRDALPPSDGTLGPAEDPFRAWLLSTTYDGAVWTALPSTFDAKTGQTFSIEAAIGYLDGLTRVSRKRAFEYIRRAPETTRTPLRQAFDARWPSAVIR